MQKTRVRVSALIMALGVALAFVLMGTNVKAADSYNFELTIDPEANINVSGAKTEVENCGLEYDVYKVADAEYQGPSGYDTYKYVNWKADFQPLQAEFEAIANNRDTVPSDWREFYKKMAELVATGKVTTQPTNYKFDPNNKKINLDEKGLYLIITRGYVPSGESQYDANNGYAGVAYSDMLRFTFEPTMIVAPTKYDDKGQMEGIIYTEGDGEWKDSAEIHLKSDRTPLYGDLIINKKVFNYTDEETSFVYQIDGADYQNFAAITLGVGEEHRNPNLNVTKDAEGNVTVHHIPVGLKVTVREVYSGGRYEPIYGDKDGRTYHETESAVIVSPIQIERDKAEVAQVYFANEYDGHNPPGHSIHNEGLYENDTFNGDGNNNHQIPNKYNKEQW